MKRLLVLSVLLAACGDAPTGPQPMPEFSGPCAAEMVAVWQERGAPPDTSLSVTGAQSTLEWFYTGIVEIFVWRSDGDACIRIRGRVP